MSQKVGLANSERTYLRLRVAVYVERDGHMLLILDPVYRGGCWTIPGGGVDFEETFVQAAEREVFEETSLIVKVHSIWRIRELWELDPDSLDAPPPVRRSFELILIGDYVSGHINIEKDPDLIAPDGLRHITDCRWIPLSELGSSTIDNIPLYPPELFAQRHQGKVVGASLEALVLPALGLERDL
jgi:8-oxo-dGTP pyrophosphatase MutT (NUDIX family)